MPVVEVPEHVFTELVSLAHQRNDPKQAKGWGHGTDWGRKPLEQHIAGLVGEWAVAQVLGVELDREINDGDKDLGDLTMPNGQRVQVKYRAKQGYAFALSTDKPEEFKADFGVLVWPADEGWLPNETAGPKGVVVVGWIARDTFMRRAKPVHYGYGKRLAVEAAWLSTDFRGLLALASAEAVR